MTAIDWTRPLVTNAGKPALTDSQHEADGAIWVKANWGCGIERRLFNHDGLHRYGDPVAIRQATPAEILAHSDVWPDWQDWARKEATYQATMSAFNVHPTEAGVMVTRADLERAVERYGLPRDCSMNEFADALGIPPAAPEKAPWEAAYEAFIRGLEHAAIPERGIWQAAVDWMLGEVCDAVNIGGPNYSIETAIRRRIMGDTK